jgi:hypothetical protein
MMMHGIANFKFIKAIVLEVIELDLLSTVLITAIIKGKRIRF